MLEGGPLPELGMESLIEYTAWQRDRWHDWFRTHPGTLRTDTGTHVAGGFATLGDLTRHVFTVERRYVQRLNGQALSDFADVSPDDVEALFAAGRASRSALRLLITSFAGDWDADRHLAIPAYADLTATPRKIVLHVLVHEIRHWAQIATLCRIHGQAIEAQDVLPSPVLGGTFSPRDR